jgi:prepilin-type processing-associated H-X9-DG protein
MHLRASPSAGLSGITRKEVLIVLAVLGVLGAIALPALIRARDGARSTCCNCNLKQVGTAFRLFANDYDGKYPWLVLQNQTNTIEGDRFRTNNPQDLWMLFQEAANELSSPVILVCPSDRNRKPTSDFGLGTNQSTSSFGHPLKRLNSLSYFCGVDITEDQNSMIAIGDRHLTTEAGRTDDDPGDAFLLGDKRLSAVGSNTVDSNLRWNSRLHGRSGNVGLVDGSVQSVGSAKLREIVNQTGDTNGSRIWLPNWRNSE